MADGAAPARAAAPGLRQYYVAVGTPEAKLTTLVELLQALRVERRLAVAVACSSRDSLDAVVRALASCPDFTIAVLHADLEPHEVEQQVQQLKRRQQPQLGEQQFVQPDGAPPSHHQQQQQPLPDGQRAAGAAAGAAAVAQAQAVAAAAAAAQAHPPAQAEPPPAAPGPQPPRQPGAPEGGGGGDGEDGGSEGGEGGQSLALVASDACLRGLGRHLTPLGLPLLVQFDMPASKDVLSRRLGAVFGSSKERGRRGGAAAGRPAVIVDLVAVGEVAAFRERERLSSAPVLEVPVHVPDIFG